MEKVLKALGIKEVNEGCSTGKNWFSGGDLIESYSPVDGKLIAKVKSATKADYDKVMKAANEAFLHW
ncbi:MAG TPA: aldehyde dehydrogenase family protein, partial [Bacteroidia bacterium]|nr:aldehyde dehydrogenase family protein [Bacteroidia bacterium]